MNSDRMTHPEGARTDDAVDGRDPLPPEAAPVNGTERTPRLRASRHLARVMDDLVTIPGTRIGIGLDSLIGLFPGIGDLIGSGMSAAILADAVRHRVPVVVLARMGWNIILDALLGLVPVAGDALDVAHRANRKNLRLLQASLDERDIATMPDGTPGVGYLAAAFVLVVLPLLLALGVGLAVLWVIVSALT